MPLAVQLTTPVPLHTQYDELSGSCAIFEMLNTLQSEAFEIFSKLGYSYIKYLANVPLTLSL